MFSGIVEGLFPVVFSEKRERLLHYGVALPPHRLSSLQVGASLSIDGVCQTVVSIRDGAAFFDAIPETCKRTTLGNLYVDRLVNVEFSLRLGEEIGGHLVAGHILDTAKITAIEQQGESRILSLQSSPVWSKYLFPKGFIALDGVSLTLVIPPSSDVYTVHLIPETLRKTTLGKKRVGDLVNVEIDPTTVAIVATTERLLQHSRLPTSH